ncbi:uncharacterized protein LOC141692687 [Apium graveolens]|uniref:uncharacterized protein LOC141692687 n=1 Tax=Apium graveolens TaxID=4045 RepID=UPI003D78E359
MPTIEATNFKIKPALLTMIQQNQFTGLLSEDPTLYLQRFQQLCSTIKHRGVTADQLKVMLFGFSLRNKAKKWLNDINVTKWNAIAQAFLTDFFPPNITDDLINKMTGGVFLDKGVDDAYSFIANFTTPHFNYRRAPKKGGKLEVEAYSLLSSQLAALTQEIHSLKNSQASTYPPMSINALSYMTPMNNLVYEVCGIQGHMGNECSYNLQNSQKFQMEQANVFQQRQRYNLYSNTYNPGWRDHLNFSYRNNNAQNLPMPNQQKQYQQSYQSSQQQQYRPFQGPMNPPGFQKPPQNYAPQASQDAQLDQTNEMLKLLMQEIKDMKPGSLPSQPTNPKVNVNVIALRSGLTYDGPPMPTVDVTDEKEKETNKDDKVDDVDQKNKGGTEGSKKSENEKIVNVPPLFVRKFPFPRRMNKTKVDQQFGKFMILVKSIEVTVPFTDLIFQVPSYAKFLKDIVIKKRYFGELETVAFTEECSDVLQNKSPPKLKDPECF